MSDDPRLDALAKTAAATATAPDATSAVPHAGNLFAGVGEQIASLLRSAEESARLIVQQADGEAATLLAAAREEAEAIVAKATIEADQLRKEATAEAARLHDTARRIEDRMRTAYESVRDAAQALPGLVEGTPLAEGSSGVAATPDTPAEERAVGEQPGGEDSSEGADVEETA